MACMAGIVLPTNPTNNGRTRSLPTSQRISPGPSTVTPCRATAADMTAEHGTWRGLRYDICLHCRVTAADMTAEHGTWRGLRYDITGIKRRCDDSSERTRPDATSVDGKRRSDAKTWFMHLLCQTITNDGIQLILQLLETVYDHHSNL